MGWGRLICRAQCCEDCCDLLWGVAEGPERVPELVVFALEVITARSGGAGGGSVRAPRARMSWSAAAVGPAGDGSPRPWLPGVKSSLYPGGRYKKRLADSRAGVCVFGARQGAKEQRGDWDWEGQSTLQ